MGGDQRRAVKDADLGLTDGDLDAVITALTDADLAARMSGTDESA